MPTITAIAFLISLVMLWVRWRVSRHPPELTESGITKLKRCLLIGSASTVTQVLIFLLSIWLGLPWQPGLKLSLFSVVGIAGNMGNITSIVLVLREPSGEGLFAALMLVIAQVFWILFTLLNLTWEF